jgi:hypothetical protein
MVFSRALFFFYRKFVKDLKNYKTPFIINPYNPCVAYATINGKQMTITWHVNDLKVSHVDPFQITKFAAYLAAIYGNGLVVHQGKIHDYLSQKYSPTSLSPSLHPAQPQRWITSSPYVRKARQNSCQEHKPKPSITQLPNSCSSANKPEEISRRLSPSSQHAPNAQTKTTGVNLNASYNTSAAPVTCNSTYQPTTSHAFDGG